MKLLETNCRQQHHGKPVEAWASFPRKHEVRRGLSSFPCDTHLWDALAGVYSSHSMLLADLRIVFESRFASFPLRFVSHLDPPKFPASHPGPHSHTDEIDLMSGVLLFRERCCSPKKTCDDDAVPPKIRAREEAAAKANHPKSANDYARASRHWTTEHGL